MEIGKILAFASESIVLTDGPTMIPFFIVEKDGDDVEFVNVVTDKLETIKTLKSSLKKIAKALTFVNIVRYRGEPVLFVERMENVEGIWREERRIFSIIVLEGGFEFDEIRVEGDIELLEEP